MHKKKEEKTKDSITRDSDVSPPTESLAGGDLNRDIISHDHVDTFLTNTSSSEESEIRSTSDVSEIRTDSEAQSGKEDEDLSITSNNPSFVSRMFSFFGNPNRSSKGSVRNNTNRRRRTYDEQALYEENCRKEDGFNSWSAFSALPVDTTGTLLDRALLPSDSSAVPVFAFVNLLRSSASIGVNLYFLCSRGNHSNGSLWSLISNSSISVLSFMLLVTSLSEIGVSEEHADETTARLFLTIAINCLWGGITLFQSGELGYHSYNQISKKNNARHQSESDPEMALPSPVEHTL